MTNNIDADDHIFKWEGKNTFRVTKGRFCGLIDTVDMTLENGVVGRMSERFFLYNQIEPLTKNEPNPGGKEGV